MSITALLLFASLVAQQPASPLISYQAMEELKGQLADLTVEVEVKLQVPDGAEPSIAPVMIGQAICIADAAGALHLITSAFLVQNSSRVRVRSKQAPEWSTVTIARFDEEVGLAELVTPGQSPACQPVQPATPHLEGPGGLVFSIDNPTEWTNIFHGNFAGRADPPMGRYLLAASGLPLGGPLYGPTGHLAALNLRRLVVGGRLYLSAPATLILEWVWGTRRVGAKHQRRPRRSIISR